MSATAATTEELCELLGFPKLTLVAFCEAILIEKAYREAAEELGTEWPAGRCAEASMDLREVLETTTPHAGAAFVWGKFTYGRGRHEWSHAWVALADGTIIDITAGQFLPRSENPGGDSTIVVQPDDRLAECYIETERDPKWARPLQGGQGYD